MNEHDQQRPLGIGENPEEPVAEEIEVLQPENSGEDVPAEEIPAEEIAEEPAEELPEEQTGVRFEAFSEEQMPEIKPVQPKVKKKFPW